MRIYSVGRLTPSSLTEIGTTPCLVLVGTIDEIRAAAAEFLLRDVSLTAAPPAQLELPAKEEAPHA